jgi:LuxR family maltose regulon positive regulatory protein
MTMTKAHDIASDMASIADADAPPQLETLEAANAALREHGGLTARQYRVLVFIADGLADKEIASLLGISKFTVAVDVRAIMAKLGARSRTHAAVIALNSGLIE